MIKAKLIDDGKRVRIEMSVKQATNLYQVTGLLCEGTNRWNRTMMGIEDALSRVLDIFSINTRELVASVYAGPHVDQGVSLTHIKKNQANNSLFTH